MLFSNKLVLAAGSTLSLALNGPGPGQYSQIVGAGGSIDVSNAILSLSLAYIPSPGDSYTIISNLTSTAILGTFVATNGLALPNGADFKVDNTVFQIDYDGSADKMDVILTAMVPEPSALVLLALPLAFWPLLRRKRRSP
jgi:hypothetical protein